MAEPEGAEVPLQQQPHIQDVLSHEEQGWADHCAGIAKR